MDVTFLIDQLGRGGAETQLTRIAISLSQRGWKVSILSFFPGNDFTDELREAGIPCVVCDSVHTPSDRSPLPFKLSWRLIRQLRAWRPSVLITFSYHSDILGRVAGRLAGVPVIVSSLRTAYAKTYVRERMYWLTESLTDLTVSNSQAGIDYMVSRGILKPHRTRVIPNGMFTSAFPDPFPREEMRAQLGVGPDTFLWLAVGVLNQAKDYPTLVKAAALCAGKSSAFQLLIAGAGNNRDALQAEADALGLQGVVRFLGKRYDVPRLLKAGDAFVLSSAWEGLPNVVMEALASGLPVVATNVGGVRELVESGRSGWVVPPQDPEALAEHMLALMSVEVPVRERMGAIGREDMVARFDQANITDRWEGLIQQISNTSRSRTEKLPPSFVISLDFELIWGVRDKRSIASYGDNILGEREAIPAMLRLFKQYGVKATWAMVGMALFDRRADLLDHLPEVRPTYVREGLNPYRDLKEIGEDERSDPYHFGLSMARQILEFEGMEIGSHTFSHFFCLEEGQTEPQFRADLAASIAATQRLTQRPVSFVFPRNQYNSKYLVACAEAGFTCFRGNEQAWMYRESAEEGLSLTRRGVRLLDHYLDLSGANGFMPREEGGLINCPSSRFLRPVNPDLMPLERLRLRRIKKAMELAARSGECFHLWWHPHNFGTQLKENLANLEELLRFHVVLRDRYGVVPLTMGGVAARARAEISQWSRPPMPLAVAGGH